MASEELMTFSKDEVERARLESEYKYQVDMQSIRVDAENEGREEGIKEGLKEGREQIARNLLAEGSTPEFIQKVTGLTLDEIEKLK